MGRVNSDTYLLEVQNGANKVIEGVKREDENGRRGVKQNYVVGVIKTI